MMISSRKQAGGTLLGLIVGLIIGLSIAVIAAMMITKTSMPFLNKSGRSDKPIATPAGQIADPNQPLYGNKPAKEAAKETEAPPVNPEPETTAPPKIATPDQPVAQPSESKPLDTKSPPKPAAAKSDSPDEKSIYYLQAGAFREQADAENIKAKLALQGFEADISERISDHGPLYRVRLGPFNQLDAANRVRSKLIDNGVDVAVVRIAK